MPYPNGYEKKINKELKKMWSDEEITKELITLPDSLSLGKNNHLFYLKSNDSIIGLLNINKVNACKIGGCTKPGPLSLGRYDHFFYMTIFDVNHKILKVKVLDYQSEYGYEICGKNWLKQFIGKKGCEISYGNDIDAISGATVSGNAIVSDVQLLCDFINKLDRLEIL